MMLYTSVLQPPEPQQEDWLVSLSCKAISLYFCLTSSFSCSSVSMLYLFYINCNIAIIWFKKSLTTSVVPFVSGKELIKCLLVLFPYVGINTIANAGAFNSSLNNTDIFKFL